MDPKVEQFMAAIKAKNQAQPEFHPEHAAHGVVHPGFVHEPFVHEIDEVDGQALLAMQLIEGPTVKTKIAERPLKLDEALDIAIQTARGLQAAHGA